MKKEIRQIENELKDLTLERNHITQSKYRRTIWREKNDYLKLHHPKFLAKVLNINSRLGSLTLEHGHSNQLDNLKDNVFRIISLWS